MPQVTIIAYPVFAHHAGPEHWWSWQGPLMLIVTEYDKYLAAWIRPTFNVVQLGSFAGSATEGARQ